MQPSSFSLFLVLSSFCLLANAQSYPGCVTSACTPFRVTVNQACGYDIASVINATDAQTTCICVLPSITSEFQTCLNCIDLSTDRGEPDYFAAICPALSLTRLPSTSTGTSSSSSTGTSTGISNSLKPTASKPSTTIASSTTDGSSPTGASLSTTGSSSSSTASSTAASSTSRGTKVPLIDVGETSTGAASQYTPVFGLAVILLAAQVGL